MKPIRKPAVAGLFYQADPDDLRTQLEDCFLNPLGPGSLPQVNPKGEHRIIGLISPHAGYMYSGPIAAHGFHRLARDQETKLAIILGPNHSGIGSPVAISKRIWNMPLGSVEIDSKVAQEIESPVINEDEMAHIREHSIEVQLPFLQYLYGARFKFVPICMLDQSLETNLRVGEILAEALSEKEAIIIASTDFTHYEPHSQAQRKDKEALQAILELDPHKLNGVVKNLSITMCGTGPVMAMLTACRILGAKKAKLISYATSGDVTGDFGAVVGYASLAVLK
ncbi:MAG: AmmeMemoRadiSam system protein B [Actinomycetota bacterium]|nr:AmmeMemoRadiSam system protein B [Actinomycetota bacterium]